VPAACSRANAAVDQVGRGDAKVESERTAANYRGGREKDAMRSGGGRCEIAASVVLAGRDGFVGCILQVLSVPTPVLHDDADLCNHAATSEGRERYFSGPCRRTVHNDVGHFPSSETPRTVAAEILALL
jgi:hypothetical protein